MVILPLVMVLPFFVGTAVAQNQSNYYVTVNPTTSNSSYYTPVGSNWIGSFQAQWSYGDNSGQPISNATVTVQVSGSKSGAITTLQLNTTSGIFSFNYSSSTAEIITFTPTKLVTQDDTQWKPNLVDSGNNIYGLHSESAVVWFDSFHVSLVSFNTDTKGSTTVTVNVTYLLLPEKGLTLPDWATYSHQTFLPKIVHNATVTINGVNAKELSAGIFTANVPIWLPTSYIHVGVSQEEWVTTQKGFSFTQSANEPFWEYIVLGALFVFVGSTLFVWFRKSNDNSSSNTERRYAVLGGALLIITSIVSLYWGLVGLDSTLHGFDWSILTLICLLTFSFGLTAGVLSILRRNQALVIFAESIIIITNMVGVKSSLDMYQLSAPWLIIIGSFVVSAISAYLVSNADEAFTKKS